MGLLLREFGIRLLDLEQALHDFWLSHLEITISGSLNIALQVDPQGMSQSLRSRRFACSFAGLSSSVGCAVFAVIRMSLLVFQQRRLFDSSTLGINFSTFVADGFNRHRLLLVDELINGGLDQTYRAFALLLVMFTEPGMRLLWSGLVLVRSVRLGGRFHRLGTPQ